MFKDYYQILGISPSASSQQIKQAYRELSLKWHPDRNPCADVKSIMQDINEAYKILKDEICRSRYDKEYYAFVREREQYSVKPQEAKTESWNYNYEVNDNDLRNDINEARVYAKNIVEEFFKDLKKTSGIAAKGALEESYGYIIVGVIGTIVFALLRTCH